MGVSLNEIKELRKKTGAGVSTVKEALEKSNGDFEKAVLYLREKGLAKAIKRGDKRAEKGYIVSYIHGDGNLGVMLELNSETDFLAKNEKFRQLAKELALQVAANTPEYIAIEDIPEDIMKREKDIALKEIDPKKPEKVREMIVQGKLQKFYEDFVLLEQRYFKDEKKKIKDLINDFVASVGEKIEIGRFVRMKLAGSSTSSRL